MVVVPSQNAIVEDTQYLLRLFAPLGAQNGERSCKQRESASSQGWINFGSLVGLWLSILIMIVPRVGMSDGAYSKSQGQYQE